MKRNFVFLVTNLAVAGLLGLVISVVEHIFGGVGLWSRKGPCSEG